MKNYGTVLWKIKIPKKLYNKVKYYLKNQTVGRDWLFNYGFEMIYDKFTIPTDFPDPQNLYRFNEKDENEFVYWQVRLNEEIATSIKKNMDWYGFSARDIIAAGLYAAKE